MVFWCCRWSRVYLEVRIAVGVRYFAHTGDVFQTPPVWLLDAEEALDVGDFLKRKLSKTSHQIPADEAARVYQDKHMPAREGGSIRGVRLPRGLKAGVPLLRWTCRKSQLAHHPLRTVYNIVIGFCSPISWHQVSVYISHQGARYYLLGLQRCAPMSHSMICINKQALVDYHEYHGIPSSSNEIQSSFFTLIHDAFPSSLVTCERKWHKTMSEILLNSSPWGRHLEQIMHVRVKIPYKEKNIIGVESISQNEIFKPY